MKNKTLLILILLFFSFCFIVFFKGLKNSNTYTPKNIKNEDLTFFSSKDFFTEEKISSKEIFINNKFYILNIWASWCLPCKNEHELLMQLSQNKSIKLVGLNYKDKKKNAKKFIEKLGNPYSKIITDVDGTISISLGAYGIPETYIIDHNRKIIKKIIGPLNKKSLKEVKLITK
jgi:cytochrome c biogenesis protein CcmG, thiol:disulfide interchange protein DsbE